MKTTLICSFVLASACFAQGLRIFIVTDMEGVGGVHNAGEQLLPGQRRYEESRRLLIGEVNAAVRGAFAGGAGEVAVWDGHDGSRTLSIDEIDPRARLIQGEPTPADFYLSGQRYDGLMFVGQHSRAGTKNGILAHTQSFNVRRSTINGREAGEIGEAAAIAGYYGIPVIMLSGDQAACDEIREIQPKAVTAAVKRMAGGGSALSISHAQAKGHIERAAAEAVRRIKEFAPWKIDGPVEMVFEYLPQPPEHPAARTETFRGRNVLEVYEAWLGKLE